MSRRAFESKVQNFVYNLEVGVGARILKGFLYVLFILVMALLYMANQYVGFNSPRAMDQAQLARSFAETGRLNTRVVRPASIRLLKEKGRLPQTLGADGALLAHPDLVNAPAWPVLMGVVFKAAGTRFSPPDSAKYGPENWVILPLNLLLVLLSGLFIYLTGRRLFDARVAFTAISVFWLANSVWAPAIAGTELPLALFFHSVAIWCALSALQSPAEAPVWKALLVSALGGLALGLAFLTRYTAAVTFPGYLLILIVGLKRRGWLPALVAIVSFSLPVVPWIWRNWAVSGTLFGLAPRLAIFQEPNEVVARSLHVPLDNHEGALLILSRLMLVIEKVLSLEKTGFGSGIVLCFFVAAFLIKFQRLPVRVMRWGALLSHILLLLAAGAFGENQLEVALILFPLVVLYGSALFHILLDRMQIGVRIISLAIVTGFVLVQALPMLAVMMPPRPDSYPPYFAAETGLVARFFQPQELVVTDMPWATAWYGGLLSLQLPSTIDEFFEIHDHVQPVRALYLTQITRNKPMHADLIAGPYRSWKQVIDLAGLPRGFPVPFFIPLRGGAQTLFADKPRWNMPASP